MDILQEFAQAKITSTAAVAATLGIGFHLSIRHVEFEKIMVRFMAVCVGSFLGMAYLFGTAGGYTILEACAKSLLAEIAFHTSLITSIGAYRLLFHRCRSFPGPFGSKLSRFYAAYLSAKNVQYNRELEKMHSKYGDFVRTGPREISILRKSAVDTIYGPGTECRKATWYGQTGNDPNKCSIHMTRDRNLHRLRRRAWDRGLAVKAVSTYEPRIKAKTDLLVDQLRRKAGASVNATDWSMFYNFDIMGEIGFGKDFGQLSTGVEHYAIKPLHEHNKLLGIFSTVPWFLYLLGLIPGAAAVYQGFFDFCANEIREKQKAWDTEKYPTDIVSWLLKAVREKDVSAAPSMTALEDDSRVAVVAGSDTTAVTLTHCFFYLVKNPQIQTKLRKLLREAMPGGRVDWTYDKAKGVTYLDDVIVETLRLKPALPVGGARETPAAGIQIDEVHIPGDTIVLAPTEQIQRDPRYWRYPNEFLPERWGEKRLEMGTDKSPYFPFSLGAANCAGKTLAMVILRTALSSIILEFDVGFAPDETGEALDKESLDTYVYALPPLQLHFNSRSSS